MFSKSGAILVFQAALMFSCQSVAGQSIDAQGFSASVPLDAVEAIIDLFDDYQIVALGEGNHNNLAGATLRLDLIRHPSFLDKVDDIVIEWGSAERQPVMDRYMTGQPVTDEEFVSMWRNTTNSWIWEPPIYAEFLAAVRERNLASDEENRVRVLLGSDYLEWENIISFEDHIGNIFSDANALTGDSLGGSWDLENIENMVKAGVSGDLLPYDIIRREVIEKERTALVIFGDMHLARDEWLLNFLPNSLNGGTLVGLLERSHPGVVYSIYSYIPTRNVQDNSPSGLKQLVDMYPELTTWRRNSLVNLKGTAIGAAEIQAIFPGEDLGPRVDPVTFELIPPEDWIYPSLESQFDGLIWLGTAEVANQYSKPLPEIVADESVYNELLRRARVSQDYSEDELRALRERYLRSVEN